MRKERNRRKKERARAALFAVLLLMAGLLGGCGKGELEGGGMEKGMKEKLNEEMEENMSAGVKESGDRTVVTLGTVWGTYNENLQSAVAAYNDQSAAYCVEVVDYLGEASDEAAAMERFQMELATGKGTDLVDLQELDADVLGYQGILTDLTALLTKEERQERYQDNVLRCAQTGDALYELGPTFQICTIVGKKTLFGEETGWSMEEMLDAFERNGKGAGALAGFYADSSVVSTLTMFSLADFVDWETGKADFCREEFYRILEFGEKRDSGGADRRSRLTGHSVSDGIHLASLEVIGSVGQYQYLKEIFGNDMAVKGLPGEGNGVSVQLLDTLGICAYSDCPEGALDFLRFYVDGEWMDDTAASSGRFFVQKERFEKQLMLAQEQRYDDAGNPLPNASFDDPDVPYVYAASREDVEEVRALIGLADQKSVFIRGIAQILDEEFGAYQQGAASVQEAAKKVQNRVQLYLDEKRQ